jgi:hypothetical protein
MEISTFELLFKPQSPAAPDGVAAVDRVVQGYFLQITNLEDEDYVYALDFVAPPVAGQPLRSLTGNALIIVDTPAQDNEFGVLNGPFSKKIYRPSTGTFTIPACGTALVAVLPSTFGSAVDPTPIAAPDFEVRGFVRLRLPAVRGFGTGVFSQFFFRPQSDRPVKVLVTPQHRATFLTATGAISDQIQTALPTANGKAMAHLDPEPGGPLVIVDSFTTADTAVLERIEDLEPAERSALLPALMAGIDPESADLTAFNKALKEAGVNLAVERRRTTEPA